MVKICTISKCAKKTLFGKILCSTQQKKCFYKLLGSFWKINFLTENQQPWTLQKWWKFCTISNALRNFFGQNSLFHSSKEVFLQTFRQFLENWIFDGKLTAADLTKLVKILYYIKCARKIFFDKILCSTHQKNCFYKLLGSFWKIEFLTGNRQPRTLQKWWKFCTISKCAKKTFFGKILCSTHQKKCFYKLLGSCWKIEFLTENRQPWTLQKWWKFVLSQNVLRKYFLTKFFVPLSKGSVSINF